MRRFELMLIGALLAGAPACAVDAADAPNEGAPDPRAQLNPDAEGASCATSVRGHFGHTHDGTAMQLRWNAVCLGHSVVALELYNPTGDAMSGPVQELWGELVVDGEASLAQVWGYYTIDLAEQDDSRGFIYVGVADEGELLAELDGEITFVNAGDVPDAFAGAFMTH